VKQILVLYLTQMLEGKMGILTIILRGQASIPQHGLQR